MVLLPLGGAQSPVSFSPHGDRMTSPPSAADSVIGPFILLKTQIDNMLCSMYEILLKLVILSMVGGERERTTWAKV